jgi:hypothetical protein
MSKPEQTKVLKCVNKATVLDTDEKKYEVDYVYDDLGQITASSKTTKMTGISKPKTKNMKTTNQGASETNDSVQINMEKKKVPYTYVARKDKQCGYVSTCEKSEPKPLSSLTDCEVDTDRVEPVGPNVHLYSIEKDELSREISQSMIAQTFKVIAHSTFNGIGSLFKLIASSTTESSKKEMEQKDQHTTTTTKSTKPSNASSLFSMPLLGGMSFSQCCMGLDGNYAQTMLRNKDKL